MMHDNRYASFQVGKGQYGVLVPYQKYKPHSQLSSMPSSTQPTRRRPSCLSHMRDKSA